MTRPARPTVVLALHDGFYGCGTGAGRSNRALLQVIASLLSSTAQLTLLPVYLNTTSPEHDPAWHTETTALLTNVDAVVHPLDNGTAGQVRFGDLNCFRHLVRHTADVLTCCVLPRVHPLLILALDAPFLGLAPLLPAHVVPNLVLVPRSTGRIHTPTDHDRIAWESHGIRTTAQHGGQIATISHYMRTHLRTLYEVPDHALIDLHNGLSTADWQLTPPENAELPAVTQEGFLLAMGRAQPYKGFDDLLHAIALLHDDLTLPHLVLAAASPLRPRIRPAWPSPSTAHSPSLPNNGSRCGIMPGASPPPVTTTHTPSRRSWRKSLHGSTTSPRADQST